MQSDPPPSRATLLHDLTPLAAGWTLLVAGLTGLWWWTELRHLRAVAVVRAETAAHLQATYHLTMMELRGGPPGAAGAGTAGPPGLARPFLWRALDHGALPGRLVALRPVRGPEPDAWERQALQSVAPGLDHHWEFLQDPEGARLRLLGVMRLETSCLGCHPGTGLAVGQVFGGVSVSQPAPTALSVLADGSRRGALAAFLAGWALVLGALALARGRQRRASWQAGRAVLRLGESEQRLREAMRLAGMGWFEQDHRSGRIVWSEETFHLLGRDPAHTLPTYDAFMEAVHPEDRVRVAGEFNRHLKEHAPYQSEYRVQRPDGEVRHLLVSCRTEVDGAGLPVRTLGIHLDLSERKRLDGALRARAEAYRVLQESSLDGCLEVDESGRVLQVNGAYLKITGLERSGVVGRRIRDLEARDDSGAAQASRIRSLGMDRFETWHVGAGNRRIPLQVSVTHLPAQGGFLYFLRDLAAEREARQALALSEARFAEAFRMSPEAILITGLGDGRIHDLNPGFEALSGWSRAEALSRSVPDLGLWADPEDRRATLAELRDLGESPARRHAFRRKDGTVLLGESRSVRIGTDLDPRALTVVRDVTELDRAEAGLRASEARFRSVFDQAGIALAMLDPGGRVRMANARLAALLGRVPADLINRPFAELLPGAPVGGGTRDLLAPWGAPVPVRCTVTPIQGAGGEPAGSLAQVVDLGEPPPG